MCALYPVSFLSFRLTVYYWNYYKNIMDHSIEDTKNFSEQDMKINVFEELNEIEEDIL